MTIEKYAKDDTFAALAPVIQFKLGGCLGVRDFVG